MSAGSKPLEIIILGTRAYHGPNIWSYGKLLEIQVDIQGLEDYPSTDPRLTYLREKLVEFIPSLQEHGCSYGEPGGFLKRLTEDGTYAAHIMEHVAIEISCLAGNDVSFGKARLIKNAPAGHYRVLFEFIEEKVARVAGRMALNLLNTLIKEQKFDFNNELEKVIDAAEETAFGPTARSIIDAAKARGIPVIRLDPEAKISLSQLGWGRHQKRIQASITSQTSNIAVDIAQDKEITAQLLYDVGIPVPKGAAVQTLEEATDQIDRIGYPLVIKPLDSSKGRGISINILDMEMFAQAFELAKSYTRTVIIEKQLPGNDYRVLVINYQFVAAAHRVPAGVTGDGKHSIKELINLTNQDPRRGIGHEKSLTRITVNDQSLHLLEQQQLSLDSIPDKERFVQLKRTANISTGGIAIDVTDQIHIENIELAERAAKVVGLDIAGIDIVAPRIDVPITKTGGGVVEVNAAPGFRMHLDPTIGEPRNVGEFVVDMLFPDDTTARIPLIAITGTNGKTTTVRIIAHILKMAGLKVGLTTTDGIYIDGNQITQGDMTGPWSARVVLRDPTVDIAVLETARGGILRAGLGWDYCNVAGILNITEDHLGVRGIDTLQELSDVKGILIERVPKDGVGLFNLDDPIVLGLVDRLDKQAKICYITLNPKQHNDILEKHYKKGGIAFTYDKIHHMITYHRGSRKIPLIKSTDTPSTLNGAAQHQIYNVMFAAAACLVPQYADLNTVRQGIKSFHTTFFQTPGRLNILDGMPKNSKIILDYAHNPAAYKAIIQTIKNLDKTHHFKKRLAVIAMPGDRPERNIREVGNMVSYFDEIIIKEDNDLRGRDKGEIAQILKEELLKENVSETNIKIILDEYEAIKFAMEILKEGELILITADDIQKSFNQVKEYLI